MQCFYSKSFIMLNSYAINSLFWLWLSKISWKHVNSLKNIDPCGTRNVTHQAIFFIFFGAISAKKCVNFDLNSIPIWVVTPFNSIPDRHIEALCVSFFHITTETLKQRYWSIYYTCATPLNCKFWHAFSPQIIQQLSRNETWSLISIFTVPMCDFNNQSI